MLWGLKGGSLDITLAYEDQSGTYCLSRGRDAAKDQSYFLFGLGREILSQTYFRWVTWVRMRCVHMRSGLVLDLG